MLLGSMSLQQGSRPGSGGIAPIPRITVDQFSDERIEDALRRRRTTTSFGIGQAFGNRTGPNGKARDAVVNGLARNSEPYGNFRYACALVAPEQRLSAPEKTRLAGSVHELLERPALLGPPAERSIVINHDP
jgi:hypothetical protein